jgi:hypothetical protein
LWIDWKWFSGIDIAKITTSRATVSTNEKSSFFIFPTFKNIWTSSLLADGMQALAFN